ncbi:MAG TPA: FAD:protein FMN transferase [Bacteroidales bacterium]|nr:FAD:protein FMN transferase [Bacteroidales bacterium]
MIRIAAIVSVVVLQSVSIWAHTQTKILTLMGVRFEITAIASTPQQTQQGIDVGIAEISRIEQFLSPHIALSEVSIINKNAGIQPVQVSKELCDLILRSKKVSELSGGLFDVSWASMDPIWRFDGSMKELPAPEIIAHAIRLINYNDIIVNTDSNTVFLKHTGMKIAFGAIGKGYAANKARDAMKLAGIHSGIVIAGGDLITWGSPEDSQQWTIGIADPREPEKAVSWLDVGELSVVTSGTYEKFTEIHGIRYSHIINPKTGYPSTGLISATIVCPDAELGDALATTCMLLGEKEALALINKIKGVDCILITQDFKIVASNNIQLQPYTVQSTYRIIK